MTDIELRKIISGGESSRVQFKERLSEQIKMAHEMIAFANTHGGIIIIGVNDKTGALNGLTFQEIHASNQRLVNTATQFIYPPLVIETETVDIDGNKLIVVTINEGVEKPYKDTNGIIYIKNGSDKRKITSNEGISLLLQEGGNLHADESVVKGSGIDEVDLDILNVFLKKRYDRTFEEIQKDDKTFDLTKMFQNFGLVQQDELTLTGLLLFSKKRELRRPTFSIQCVSMDNSIVELTFKDTEGAYTGNMSAVLQKAMDFIGRNMRKIPDGEGFNAPTKWEVPSAVFVELLVNAIVHRDYYLLSPIKVYVFADRVEIVSPGKLPNSLTVNLIKNGVAAPRNPVLLSFAKDILPYRGYGSGIPRAISLWKDIEFINDEDTNQFTARVKRHDPVC
jgi:predicted HTH transcriptional regulator